MSVEKFDPEQHENCGTPKCCHQCDTATLGPDWYLVGIGPWHKTLFNPTTGEKIKVETK